MGLFRKRRETSQPASSGSPGEGAGPTAEPSARTPEEERFASTLARWDLQAASDLLDEHIAATAPASSPDGSLLARAAVVRRALLGDQLDAAADELVRWETPYAAFGTFLDAGERATLNALGILLLDYFAHPQAASHGAYDDLMDTQLAGVAKATRIGSPTRQTPWDPVYARIKSDREIGRL